MWNINFSPHCGLSSDISEYFVWRYRNIERGLFPLATSVSAGASRHLEASFQGFMEL